MRRERSPKREAGLTHKFKSVRSSNILNLLRSERRRLHKKDRDPNTGSQRGGPPASRPIQGRHGLYVVGFTQHLILILA
jgi:hypothetical protein